MITLTAVSDATMSEAESCLLACERCSPEAETPFDWLLDEVTGRVVIFRTPRLPP